MFGGLATVARIPFGLQLEDEHPVAMGKEDFLIATLRDGTTGMSPNDIRIGEGARPR